MRNVFQNRDRQNHTRCSSSARVYKQFDFARDAGRFPPPLQAVRFCVIVLQVSFVDRATWLYLTGCVKLMFCRVPAAGKESAHQLALALCQPGTGL